MFLLREHCSSEFGAASGLQSLGWLLLVQQHFAKDPRDAITRVGVGSIVQVSDQEAVGVRLLLLLFVTKTFARIMTR